MFLCNLFESSDLPMDPASRFARAKAMGFTVRAYHGTGSDVHEFSLEKGKPNRGGGHGPNFSDVPAEASGYADSRIEDDGLPGNVLPCLLRITKPFIVKGDKTLSSAQFLKLTGGIPTYWKGDTKHSTRDVMDTLFMRLSRTDKLEAREVWTRIYAHFQKLGFDGFYFPDTLRDFDDDEPGLNYHTKFVVFDPKNVRSIFAKFDPAKSDSAELLA